MKIASEFVNKRDGCTMALFSQPKRKFWFGRIDRWGRAPTIRAPVPPTGRRPKESTIVPVFDVNQAFAAKLVYASELADPPKHKGIRAKFYS